MIELAVEPVIEVAAVEAAAVAERVEEAETLAMPHPVLDEPVEAAPPVQAAAVAVPVMEATVVDRAGGGSDGG